MTLCDHHANLTALLTVSMQLQTSHYIKCDMRQPTQAGIDLHSGQMQKSNTTSGFQSLELSGNLMQNWGRLSWENVIKIVT